MAYTVPAELGVAAQSSSRITVKGTGDAGSTIFVIPRDVTIASDSKPHKVTVMMATLAPQMVHSRRVLARLHPGQDAEHLAVPAAGLPERVRLPGRQFCGVLQQHRSNELGGVL